MAAFTNMRIEPSGGSAAGHLTAARDGLSIDRLAGVLRIYSATRPVPAEPAGKKVNDTMHTTTNR
jgi:hypothetical protein